MAASLVVAMAGRRRMASVKGWVAFAVVFATAAGSDFTASAAPVTTRVSVSSDGTQGRRGGHTYGVHSMTPNGRFVVFVSKSPGLVPGDGPDLDAFVRDRRNNTTTLVTARNFAWASIRDRRTDGGQDFFISSDGRYIAFASFDDDLVPGDTNEAYDIFVRDTRRRTTSRLVRSDGGQIDLGTFSPSLSKNGRYLVFVSRSAHLVAGDRNGRFDVFVRDRRTDTTRMISRGIGGRPANGESIESVISANGRYVAFSSRAKNIVRNDTNRNRDVFVYDRVARRTIWSTVSSTGGHEGSIDNWRALQPDISANGRYVAFKSDAPNLVPGDGNRRHDMFIRDLHADTTQRVSVASGGREVCVGRFAHRGAQCHGGLSLSSDGRFVAFSSAAPDLVPGDTNQVADVFVHDARTLVTTRASVSASAEQICRPFSDDCTFGWHPISARGRFVAFTSRAANVVAGDTNKSYDVFVRGPLNWLDPPPAAVLLAGPPPQAGSSITRTRPP